MLCRIPAGRIGFAGDIVAGQPGNGNGREILNADFAGKSFIVGDNLVEHGLVVIDQIHFIHGQNNVANAQQMHQIAVAARLRQNTFGAHQPE